MLRITRQTDYGIMLLAHLAALPAGRVVSAREASEWSGLSLPMVSKILKALAHHQILVSQRGSAGGYLLARSPGTTTLADVIRALEGPISMVECGALPGHCEQEPICPVKVNWARINQVLERALEQVPISEMIAPHACDALSPVGAVAASGPPASGLHLVEHNGEDGER